MHTLFNFISPHNASVDGIMVNLRLNTVNIINPFYVRIHIRLGECVAVKSPGDGRWMKDNPVSPWMFTDEGLVFMEIGMVWRKGISCELHGSLEFTSSYI